MGLILIDGFLRTRPMSHSIRFETPENVRIQYSPAGLGTRFLAWFVDQLVVWALVFVLIVALMVAGFSFDSAFESLDRGKSADSDHAVFYFFGLMILIWGLGSFLYFGALELFLRGQTIGKRMSNIRVVSANGFQLDAASVVVRNLFRVVDHLPPMWIFPFISRLGQRSGDMVAGTLVVFDAPTQLSSVRGALATRTATESQFRFDLSMLKRLTGRDFEAIESVLERCPDLPPDQRAPLLEIYGRQIATKLQIDPPPADQQLRFLEDLFAAELRRQDRSLV